MDGWRLGGRVDGRLADGTRVRPRVVAILDDTLGAPEVLLALDLVVPHQAAPLADSVHVTVRDGADPDEVAAALRARLAATGAVVTPIRGWLAAGGAQSQRVRDLAVLRLAGMTVAQLMRALTWATLMVLAVGVIFGAVAADGEAFAFQAGGGGGHRHHGAVGRGWVHGGDAWQDHGVGADGWHGAP
jgi:putative ABC transport system permease protein